METTFNLLEKKLKGYSVAQLKSKLQRGCPENEKAICIEILKKRNEDTSQWEVPNEKLGVFINEDVEITSEEAILIENAEIAQEKVEKTKLSKLKDILKESTPKTEKPKVEKVKIEKSDSIQVEGFEKGDKVSFIAQKTKETKEGIIKSIFFYKKAQSIYLNISDESGHIYYKAPKSVKKI